MSEDLYFIGKLNYETIASVATGSSTYTADTTVDEGVISVAVKRVPHAVTFTKGETVLATYDGNTEVSVAIPEDVAWGNIVGDIEDQEDLQEAFESFVHYDRADNKTSAEQSQARANIDAQKTIGATNKLSADFVDDASTTNKFVTVEDKENWDNKVTANASIVGGTKTKITYDNKGLVTAGENLVASDIPSLDASKISSGTFADERIASASAWNTKIADVTQNGQSIVDENYIAKIVLETGLGSDSNNSATVTAIRAFVNSSIEAVAAYYITSNASGDAFATKAAIDAGPWYYAGALRTPTRNDYAIVIADETHEGKTARYTYVKADGATTGYWNFQYTFNMQFTQAQIDAMNSGINSAKVALYDAHLINYNNPHQVTKAQVGLGNVTNDAQVKRTEMGVANGVATLDANGKVPVSQIPDSISPLDTNVKLSSQLKTYYNIGKITTASGTNPVVIGNAGDSIRDVLNNLTQMDEIQPSITSNPAISTLSFSSSASDEYGTEITTVNYSLTTSQGSYTYQPSPTGVTWSKYTFSGGCASTDKTTTTGSLTLTNTYTVGVSSAVSFDCVGTHSAGGIAKTNLGNNSNPIIQIQAGTKSKTANFSKTMVSYPYYTSTSSTTTPTAGTKGATSIESASGATVSYTNQQYLWILSVNNNANKKIQIYSDLTKSWADMLGGTVAPVQVTFTMANGKTRTYYAYRTLNVSQSSGSALIRLN